MERHIAERVWNGMSVVQRYQYIPGLEVGYSIWYFHVLPDALQRRLMNELPAPPAHWNLEKFRCSGCGHNAYMDPDYGVCCSRCDETEPECHCTKKVAKTKSV
jgi:hypothetical protein